MFIYSLDGDGTICRIVIWFYFHFFFFVMQAGTGIAELIALEISKKVSNMFVLIFSVKLLVFLDGVSFIFF